MLGLYVQVPFRRSPHVYDEHGGCEPTPAAVERFRDGFRREVVEHAGPFLSSRRVETVYVGGSRPSLLPPGTDVSMTRAAAEALPLSSVKEVTVEVHPADLAPRLLRTLRRIGVTRLSISVLSFFPDDLRAVGAAHSAEQARRAPSLARNAGFDDLSIDLLYGWPEQSSAHWHAVLEHAVERDLPHLTLQEAPSWAGPSAGDDVSAPRLEHAMQFLRSEGYEQYELTHFARPGFRSRHQERYYAHEPYLGLGPGAASFWWPSRPDPAGARRWTNAADLAEYDALLSAGRPPVAECHRLNRTELAEEYVMLRLRTAAGLDLDALAERYGLDLRTEKAAFLDRLRDEGLAHDERHCLRLTPRGRLLTDGITARLLR